MSVRSLFLACLVTAFAAACGGSVFSHADEGEGGSSNTAGAASQAGSTSTSGKPSLAGSSSQGGTTSSAGSPSAGSTGVAGGVNCELVDCPFPLCTDGQSPVTLAGQCCPSCPPPKSGCDNVECQPVLTCPDGYSLSQPVGACCQGCVPAANGVVCPQLACPHSVCPLGYVRGDLVGGCCTECVPDALFCNDNSDCLVANQPRSCCGCARALSVRQYQADPCWSDLNLPRMVPTPECAPQQVCNVSCVACTAGSPVCQNHRCIMLDLK